MKKKITFILLVTLATLFALTGCQMDKTNRENTKSGPVKESVSKEKKPTEAEGEAPEDAPSQDVMNSIPEGTPVVAPPVDADGNLPEEFDADEYYMGYAEKAKKAQEAEEKTEQEAKDRTEKDEK